MTILLEFLTPRLLLGPKTPVGPFGMMKMVKA